MYTCTYMHMYKYSRVSSLHIKIRYKDTLSEQSWAELRLRFVGGVWRN